MSMQYGIKEVLDLLIRDYSTKEPVAFINYAQASENSVESEQTQIFGGRSNGLLMTFDHTKTSTMTLTLPIVDISLLAMLGGSKLEDSTKDLISTERLVVGAGGVVTLGRKPVNDEVAIFAADGDGFGEEILGAVALEEAVTIDGADEGVDVFAVYQYAAPTGSKLVKVTSNTFPSAVSITGYGLARRRDNEKDYPVHVDVYKARPQANFTFNLSGTDATELTLVFDVLEGTDSEGRKTYIDYTFLEED